MNNGKIKHFKKHYDFEKYIGNCNYNGKGIEKRVSKDAKNVVLILDTISGKQLQFKVFTIKKYNSFIEHFNQTVDENDTLSNAEYLIKMQDWLFNTKIQHDYDDDFENWNNNFFARAFNIPYSKELKSE